MREIIAILLFFGWFLLGYRYPDALFRLSFFRHLNDGTADNRIRRIAAVNGAFVLIIFVILVFF